MLKTVNLVASLILAFTSLSSFADTPKNDYKSTTTKTTNPPLKTAKMAPTPSSFTTPIVLKDGPYIGAAAGYDSYKVQEKIPLVGGGLNGVDSHAINGTGLVGQLLAGYGRYFNNALYLGGEVFSNISTVYQNGNATLTSGGNTLSYSSKFMASMGYGASLLPGIKLNDAGLVFLKLGYHITRLRGHQNFAINAGAPTSSNNTSWSGGFGYGIGFEEAMAESFSLRGEYIHIDYRTFQANSNTTYSPSDNQFMLSLVYHLTG
jgi:hypothetical protein